MSTASTTVTGTSSSDTIKTSSGDDIINAGAGSDTVYAGAGDDTVDGGSGSDWVDAGAGNDLLIYTFESSATQDTYLGGSGTDLLQIRISQADAERSGLSQQIATFTQLVASLSTSSGNLSEGKPATFTFTFWNGATLTVSTIESAVVFITDSAATGTVTLQSAVEGQALALAVAVSDPDGPITAVYELQVEDSSGQWLTLATANDPGGLAVPDDQSWVDARARVRMTTTDSGGGVTVLVSNSVAIANVDDEAQGVLTVTGAPQQGGELRAALQGLIPDTTATDADGDLEYVSYQWQQLVDGAWQDLPGGSSTLLMIPNDQSMVGQQVRVLVTTTDIRGGTTEFTREFNIANVDEPVTGTPIIDPFGSTGFPSAVREGATLRVNLADVDDPDRLDLSKTAYAWEMLASDGTWQPLLDDNGQPLATGEVQVPDTQEWVNQTIRARVTVQDMFGAATTLYTAGYHVMNVDDDPTLADGARFLTVQGTAQEGGRLEVDLAAAGLSDEDGGIAQLTMQWSVSDGNGGWADWGVPAYWFSPTDGTAGTLPTAFLDIPGSEALVGKQVRLSVETEDALGGLGFFESDPVTIAGVNDPAVISGMLTAQLTESNSTLSASGTLTVTDEDSPATFNVQNNTLGSWGFFSITQAGNWNYRTKSAFNEMRPGETRHESFTVTTSDGTSAEVAITITGTDDAPVMSVTSLMPLQTYNDTLRDDLFPTSTGTITWSDPDTPVPGATFRIVDPATGMRVQSLTTPYGTLSITPTNLVTQSTVTFTPTDSGIEALGANESYVQMFQLEGTSGSGSPTLGSNLYIAFTGVNDPSTIGGTTSGMVMEDGNQMVSGTLTLTDRDAVAGKFDGAISTPLYGMISFDPASGKWDYALNNLQHDVQALSSSSLPLIDSITVQTDDGASQEIRITIYGADEPVEPATAYVYGQDGVKSATVPLFLQVPDSIATAGLTYQWWSRTGGSDWAPISDALDSPAYDLSSHAGIVGAQVRLVISDANGNEVVTSNTTSVKAVPSGNPVLPADAIMQDYNILVAARPIDIADADGGTIATSYRWSTDKTLIANGPDAFLDLAVHQIAAGTRINLTITTTDSFGGTYLSGTSYVTEAYPPQLARQMPDLVANGVVSVSGVAAIGQTLTADTAGVLMDEQTSVDAFGWEVYRNGTWEALAGSSSDSLLLSEGVVIAGEYVRARIDTTNAQNVFASVYSIAQRVAFTTDPMPDSVDFGVKPLKLVFYAGDGFDACVDTLHRTPQPQVPEFIRFVVDGLDADGPADAFINFTGLADTSVGGIQDQIYLANDAGSGFHTLATGLFGVTNVLASTAFQSFNSGVTGSTLPDFGTDTGIAYDRDTGAIWLVDPNGPDIHFMTITGTTHLTSNDFAIGTLANASLGW